MLVWSGLLENRKTPRVWLITTSDHFGPHGTTTPDFQK